MYIVQVCSGILPRYLSHYQVTDTGLTPVITVSKSKAMPLTDADIQDAFNRLLPAWPLMKVVEA
ncbi:hypothetical protein AB4077_21830 [Vibrio cyclitrophicus]|uniref:hypothetical protein n=1 Tax=Vibrio TaxID=662 RepID=UPI00076AA410|nr:MULTISPECIES: hypothetical protein [Vibrio]MCC4773205.1 hypothetical protein [Vibrio cyclitrophicus]MCC4844566.1 hypothetical protein [Vibrio cyclitrophicus]PME11065.1 hypothetical protein BCV42_21560 [Vibrio cyclitrophicus]PME53012.1 hypothetical protein BCV37_10045 [Vibrio cyclitrophicus]PME78120.1 hypothetical protein BCV28_21595 [Vibrio cyclitrophicus]